jgi:hypothetical protein
VEQRLCGVITNETHNRREPAEMILTRDGPFAGRLAYGNGLLRSGRFNGEQRNGQCRAATDSGLPFEGACTASSFKGRWAAMGQTGALEVSADGCGAR